MSLSGKPRRILVTKVALGLAMLVTPTLASVANEASSASLPCIAHVDNAHPTDYSTVVVSIHTRSHARITTTAHYRTTNTVKTTVASASGSASVAYRISRATGGFRVIVTVVARVGAVTGSCTTSFTPV
jgi:hypothetical protein